MHDITERKALEEKLSLLAAKEQATRLTTLRAFDEALEREWSRTVRENSNLSLLLIDFNHFKQFHSRRPHVEGGGCLEKAAGVVIAAVRLQISPLAMARRILLSFFPLQGAAGRRRSPRK
jgi:GGDEF domain-containing protein